MSASAPQPEGLDRETLIVAGVVLLGAIMSILDTTVVNVAIDHLAVAFHSSLTDDPVGHHRLHAGARRGDPDQRLGGGPIRHQAHLPVVAGAVHARIGAVGPGLERRLADLLPRPAGHRRRNDHAGGHDDHDQEGRASPDGPRDGRARRADAGRADPRARSSAAGWSTTRPGAGSSSSTCRSGSSRSSSR